MSIQQLLAIGGGLIIILFAGGWVGLILLASRRLRQLGRGRLAARVAIAIALALLAWFPVALLRAHVDAAGAMHQYGSTIIAGAGEQSLDGRAALYRLAGAELRWRSILPLRPACVTGAREVCARIDDLGLGGPGWHEGVGPALVAASLAWALMLPPAASRRRGLVGGLLIAYGGVSAGMLLVEASPLLSVGPAGWLFVLPGTPYWPGAVPAQLGLAALIAAAGAGVRRGLPWGPPLALAYAAATALLAVGIAYAGASLVAPELAFMVSYGSVGNAVVRAALSAAIVAALTLPPGRAPLGPGAGEAGGG